MGTCHCEASGCTSGHMDGRTRTFLLTKEEFDKMPKNKPHDSDVMKILFDDVVGKPVCLACQNRLRQEQHIIMEAFPKPKAESDKKPVEAPAGTS